MQGFRLGFRYDNALQGFRSSGFVLCVCLSNILGYDIMTLQHWVVWLGKWLPHQLWGSECWNVALARWLCYWSLLYHERLPLSHWSIPLSLVKNLLSHWSTKNGPLTLPCLTTPASQPGSAETGETCDFQSRKFLEVAMFKNAPILAVRVGLAKWWSGWVPLHLVSAGSWAFFALSLVKPSSVIGQRLTVPESQNPPNIVPEMCCILLYVELNIGSKWTKIKFDPQDTTQLKELIYILSHFVCEVPQTCWPVLLPRKV